MTESSRLLVTGASSGIGLAIARRLLQRGNQVIGLSRRPAPLDDPNFVAMTCDLEHLADTDTLLRSLVKQQAVDGLVHAAGQGHFGSIEQFSPAQIEASLRVNLTAAMVICRVLLPSMRRRQRGRIILLGSESALAAGRKGALYSAAKFGLRGFSQALREDCAADNIQVSLINPGMVRSPFFEQQSFAPGDDSCNAIDVEDVATLVVQILDSSPDIVFDEVNLSPRIKSINFSNKHD